MTDSYIIKYFVSRIRILLIILFPPQDENDERLRTDMDYLETLPRHKYMTYWNWILEQKAKARNPKAYKVMGWSH